MSEEQTPRDQQHEQGLQGWSTVFQKDELAPTTIAEFGVWPCKFRIWVARFDKEWRVTLAREHLVGDTTTNLCTALLGDNGIFQYHNRRDR